MHIDKHYKNFLKSSSRNRFENEILYQMCKASSSHDDFDITRGKIILIGRSYAASLERTPYKVDGDMYQRVFKAMKNDRDENGMTLDAQLKDFQKIKDKNEQNLSMVSTVLFLNGILKKVVGINKISLSSKYLHFHCPLFPIYDSLSTQALRGLIDIADLNKYPQLKFLHGKNDIYSKHVAKIMYLEDRLACNGYPKQTARDIDTFLLWWLE
jgi:hypothetical protein